MTESTIMAVHKLRKLTYITSDTVWSMHDEPGDRCIFSNASSAAEYMSQTRQEDDHEW